MGKPKGNVMGRHMAWSIQILTLLHQGAVLDIQSLEDLTGSCRRSAYRYFSIIAETLPIVELEPTEATKNDGRGVKFQLLPEARLLRRG